MGCDIHGWIEIASYPNSPDYWQGAVRVGALLGRNYDMFGLLFGVRNYATYHPIAPCRGPPTNPSRDVRDDYIEDGCYHSASFITLAEIESINWDAESDGDDERVHEYVRDGDTLVMAGKFLYNSALDQHMHALRRNRQVEVDGKVYRLEKTRARDCLSADWELVFGLMRQLGERYGKNNVRLVVWFDN